MAWAAAILAIGSIAGGAISSRGSRNASEEAQENRINAVEGLQGANNDLVDRLLSGNYNGFGASDVFGSRIIGPDGQLGINVPGVVESPSDLAFNEIDITQEQIDTIFDNANILPAANELSNATNASIVTNDLNRIRALNPTYDESVEAYTGATRDLLQGRLPFDTIEDLFSDRGELANAFGTPGGSTPLALRDLGLNSLDAINQGAGMFTNFLANANQNVSPINSQIRPQEFFLSPEFRTEKGIQQESLRAQAAINVADLASRPDPTAAALFQNDLFTNQTAAGILGAGQIPVNHSAALGQGVQQASQLAAQYYQQQQLQNNQANLNNNQNTGAARPI